MCVQFIACDMTCSGSDLRVAGLGGPSFTNVPCSQNRDSLCAMYALLALFVFMDEGRQHQDDKDHQWWPKKSNTIAVVCPMSKATSLTGILISVGIQSIQSKQGGIRCLWLRRVHSSNIAVIICTTSSITIKILSTTPAICMVMHV